MMGIFGLNNAADLVKKLRHDFELLKLEPGDRYIAYNYFVTAEHIPDWLYPKRHNKERREHIRSGSLLLKICSHIASGAKHFEVEAKHHDSVIGTNRTGGAWPDGAFPKGAFPRGSFIGPQLYVSLKSEAEIVLGKKVSVVQLASQILSFWENNEDIKKLLKGA